MIIVGKVNGLVSVAAVLSLAFAGCAKSKNGDITKVMRGMQAGSGYGARGTNMNLAQGARAQARTMFAQAQGSAWLLRFQAESGQLPSSLAPALSASYDSTYGCSGTGAVSTNSFGFSCTMASTVAFDCKGTSYTISKGGTWGLTIGCDTSACNATSPAPSVYTFTLALNATVSGGDLDATALACSFNFSINVAALTDADDTNDNITIDCANSANKCTFGAESFGCSEFETEVESADNAC